ncbi:ABC transporter permease [Metamycoplasma hyosynoviae]|uniref:Sugar ABC transporter permease n=1 Tax=Metamycoplasma hyosynoviae TaxID=29559 RepID=A0A9Q9BQ37_9BACT|nr:sugar ABC transporter permease [Metamycoplasma hyosynoviae]KDE41584.1 ABC transporter permease [Metamycoplasma hyosynoviae]KDE43127.1 ABC transporter permease [Metamycoplasma hyosynoviae]KDE43528.1 ABC transporter permease [Metamycoplasma hyosynoviae]KDE43645.1 ABC transporter permease [Metamycoplasma hyosynoviae]MDC8917340.1 sugar ABC transporter permease [Metamycoplasma hyosynoviae]
MKNLYFIKKYRVKNIGDSLTILNQKTPFWKPMLLILPSFILMMMFVLIPFILVIIRSALTSNGLELTEKNFVDIMGTRFFKRAIYNSILYSLMALPISLCISILISVAITLVVKRWARSFWQTVFFLPYVTSAVAVSMSFAFMFSNAGGTGGLMKVTGLINSILIKLNLIGEDVKFLYSGDTMSWKPFIVILVRGVWGNLAFQILILTTAMLSVDQQLYKSAAIDGANKRKQFFTITLPSIKRTISFLITIGLINGIKVFPLALYSNNADDALRNGASTLMLIIFNYTAKGQYNIAGATSVILFVIGVILSFSLRRLVTLIYKLSIKSGEKNVARKIETSSLKSKAFFKV